VEREERIRRMETDGILTAAQAAMLRDSLADFASVAGGPQALSHRAVPAWAVAAATATVIGGLILTAALSGGDHTAIQDVTQTLNQPGGYGEMNKWVSVAVALGLLVLPPLLIWTWLHNSLVLSEEKVFAAWAQTESNFQRRADLVPALVDTVSRYLKHESETLSAIARERTQAAADLPAEIEELLRAEKASSQIMRESGRKIVGDEARMQQLFEAERDLQARMSGLVAVAEAYPELRSADQFLELQAQLEGTENRLNVARMRFNDAVRDYNSKIRMLPWSLAAALGNFQRKAYFRSAEESRRAPDLAFD
jgi:LemA protein